MYRQAFNLDADVELQGYSYKQCIVALGDIVGSSVPSYELMLEETIMFVVLTFVPIYRWMW